MNCKRSIAKTSFLLGRKKNEKESSFIITRNNNGCLTCSRMWRFIFIRRWHRKDRQEGRDRHLRSLPSCLSFLCHLLMKMNLHIRLQVRQPLLLRVIMKLLSFSFFFLPNKNDVFAILRLQFIHNHIILIGHFDYEYLSIS